MKLILGFILTLAAFLLIDLLWLGVVAQPLYADILGDLLAKEPNWTAAFIFYALYVVGIFYFAILPAVQRQSLKHAVINGGLFGFFNYMTYDLTNLAVVENWPAQLTYIDLPWGVALTASTALCGYLIMNLKFLKP